MSRLGKKPISVPAGVKVTIDQASGSIQAEGPKGKLRFSFRREVLVTWVESTRTITCSIRPEDESLRPVRALWGTTRSRIANMIEGVSKGFSRKLEVVGVGWNAKPAGGGVQLSLGFCKPVVVNPPPGVSFTIEGATVTVSGPDAQAVGEFAAQLRSRRPPEPYNGKGVKYSDEVIIRKQGKVFGA
jgi:large subunit ribosomal protein L6